ncbi:unnamed protein product [Fusarium graminearum]|uniref:Chromosome 3, complete genome n=1 Tax=Gibberella zeae (strain ATCC MYA-4620 / CBS 123657 / FGSC 9075 / NRRL 31084 / PH-1) TaxID=229533 RepID=A0A0E0SM68_GIBZE|nr:hypothetical protein FG05_35107 [Fusarium graminearum]CEF87531.1 unnamed protein product [Fusarium graminearum]
MGISETFRYPMSMKLVLMVLHKATIDKSRDSYIDFKVVSVIWEFSFEGY